MLRFMILAVSAYLAGGIPCRGVQYIVAASMKNLIRSIAPARGLPPGRPITLPEVFQIEYFCPCPGVKHLGVAVVQEDARNACFENVVFKQTQMQ
ncbi:hypothetical protein PS689_00586 [Pseudomonas fluorescens]|nr:hypothetical protein PS689_00586 [Pseudomonas fluorescens]